MCSAYIYISEWGFCKIYKVTVTFTITDALKLRHTVKINII